MLKNIFITFNFHRFMQSGSYLDFFVKKWAEIFIKNIFIYSSQFFSEKYIIEYLTKKLITNLIFVFNKKLSFFSLNYFFFFIQLISIIFYFFSFLNLIFFLL